MKRFLSLVLVLALALTMGIFSASAESVEDPGFVDGKFTETRHIKVEIFNRNNDGGSDPTNNVFTDYIKAGMLQKYNVEVEFVSVGRWTEVDDINNLLATGEAPDICVTYSYPTIQTFADMGGIVDLNPYLTAYKDQLGDLWALLEDYNIYYDQNPETKTVWALEAVLADRARLNTFIRKDWLDKLGLALPTTEEEFYNCLVAFRDNAETLLGADKDKMVPYSTSTDIGWRNDLLSISKVPENVDDATLYVYGYDDRHLLYPNYKEGIRVLNKWYNEGLVWKDFGLYTDSTAEDDMMKAGYVGAFIHNWDYPFRNNDDSIEANLVRNVGPDAAFVAVDCFKNEAGITRKFLADRVDRKVFFPATNKEPLASLLYVNFISDPETIKFLQTGKEGVNHELTADGAYKTLAATGEYVMNSGMNIDYTITVNGLYLGEATDASRALNYSAVPAEIVVGAHDAAIANGRTAKHYNVGDITAETDVGTSLTAKRDAMLTQAVSASVDQFDAVYDAGMADYLASGGQAIIDERAEKLLAVYGETPAAK
ncbi:MAG: extracellular solute-binding protein [Clostridia bacterium]|nr:extracellular solute-binding protein [Clostridia bacterium]